MTWIVSLQKPYADVLPLTTSECYCIWRQDLERCNWGKMRSYWWALRAKDQDTDTHRGKTM